MAWYLADDVLRWSAEDYYVDWDGATSTFGTFTIPVPPGVPFLPLQFSDSTEFDAAVEICSAESWGFQSRPRDGGGSVFLHASHVEKLRAFLARPRPENAVPRTASIALPGDRPMRPPDSLYDPQLDEPRQSGPALPDGATSVSGKPLGSLRDYWRE